MKRALAERAKQSGHPSGLAPPHHPPPRPSMQTPSSSSMTPSSSAPPSSNTNTNTNTNTSESLQRQRVMPNSIKSSSLTSSTTATPSYSSSLSSKAIPKIPRVRLQQVQSSSDIPRVKVPKVTSSSSTTSFTEKTKSPRPKPSTTTSSSSHTPGSGNTTPRPSTSSTSTSGKKRQRTTSSTPAALVEKDSSSAANEDATADESSAFYLKHQNRALASELKQMKHHTTCLEHERDERRAQTQQALQLMTDLEAAWTSMEVVLKQQLLPNTTGNHDYGGDHNNHGENNNNTTTATNNHNHNRNHPINSPSTGNGESVELMGALVELLETTLYSSTTTPQPMDMDDNSNEATTETLTTRSLEAVSSRARLLQQCILKVLTSSNGSSTSTSSSSKSKALQHTAELTAQISTLQSKCKTMQTKIQELAKARDDATNSDRRVRRGLYRLASKRMKLEEVLKAVEDDNHMDGTHATWVALEEAAAAAAAAAASTTPRMNKSSSSAGQEDVSAIVKREDGQQQDNTTTAEQVDSAELAKLKKQLQDLEEIASSRETQIDELIKERESHQKRINELTLPPTPQSNNTTISENDVLKSNLYTETSTKLSTVERQLEEVRTRMADMKKDWSIQKGDSELARKALNDLMVKQKKRWTELTGEDWNNNTNNEDTAATATAAEKGSKLSSNNKESIAQAKRVVELEHKLKQALENVRQAESTRVSLAEAMKMNEQHQMKLEELKSKNAALVATKSAARASAGVAAANDGGVATTPGGGGTSSSSSSSLSLSKGKFISTGDKEIDRMFRKVRKELSAALLSKEGAKGKQDRAEKERDALVKTNARLLKQSTEKDDMNAKSLSTILHLKHMTEKLEQEKDIMEQTKKSATQLALAARLATNAKERVHEEALKQTKSMEEQLAKEKEECDQWRQQKEKADGKLIQLNAEIVDLKKNVTLSNKRCQELAEESTKAEEDKRRLLESLAVAQREANESKTKYANMCSSSSSSKSGGGSGDSRSSGFTADQLATQVSVLKGRLACPVCNHRDKKCILLRCRHMFCKQCVEENVRNRSRKCPACGQRFDNKDVADVWL